MLRATRVVVIEDNASLSSPVASEGFALAGILVPAGWVTADITFQASADGTNWFNLFDDTATEVTVEAAAESYVAFDGRPFRGIPRLKVRSGTAASPVPQTSGPIALQLHYVAD